MVQKRAHPDIQPTTAALSRAERTRAARRVVLENLPVSSKNFRRVDLDRADGKDFYREMNTLELMAAGIDLITNARFAYNGWAVNIDALLNSPKGYLPVLVSNHRVARRKATSVLPGVPTHRLGLSAPLDLPYKLRHHAVDGYRLALAARGLAASGLDSGQGVVIGQDRDTAFFVDTTRYQPSLSAALEQPLPTKPRRVKECAVCRFWPLCHVELKTRDDISLFLPGDEAEKFRTRGIDTVGKLAAANLGEVSTLARAWQEDIALLRRPTFAPAPRADVEVDVDMEAYLDQGAYLWGAWHGGKYHPFVTWKPLGGAAEAENFQAFWNWLQGLRDRAHAEGKTFAAYCYSAGGENHWMLESARRFGQPTVEEVQEFISSEEWVDMFALVRHSFAATAGMGLKVVAPLAGHTWAEDDFSGEESVDARRAAVHGDLAARRRLLEYNEGDVRATLTIRDWMSRGAPGLEDVKQRP
ncbi:recombinase RecB [Corynebacterium phocae]|uniref:Recombinase RecB n=1 Tax=Corynebacterium phocae TaxID=161895 RepID=A0A1L7D6R0_9CORY|nr:recombinase RecB [Corynebacterium phocae]